MTHVAHPYAQRIGILRDWKSRWFAKNPKQYRDFLTADTKIRSFLEKRLKGMYVAAVEIERSEKVLRIIVKTSRPGLIIGRQGEGAQRLKKDLEKEMERAKLVKAPELRIDIEEVRSPESNAAVVAQMIVEGLEKRLPFRRIMKQTVDKVMANRDTEGVRIVLSGRLGGAEMSRKEEIKKGRLPLQTLRADIDYSSTIARLPYGVLGVKVWIYRGEVFEEEQNKRGGKKSK